MLISETAAGIGHGCLDELHEDIVLKFGDVAQKVGPPPLVPDSTAPLVEIAVFKGTWGGGDRCGDISRTAVSNTSSFG